jgi:murein DD-endopeptidase MepM/ murein hydrolase activator NlpD
MRRLTTLSALALALLLPPAAAGFVADPAPVPAPLPPEAVHPVLGSAGYGEIAARFGGPRAGRSHEGQDVFAPAGTPLVAVRDGVVLETGSGDGRGNYLALYSPEARQTYLYYHLMRPASVRAGERVQAGDRVGHVGCTGSCWGDHLHFEARRGRGLDGAPQDPLPLLRRWSRD